MEYETRDEAFMARELRPGALGRELSGKKGTVKYHVASVKQLRNGSDALKQLVGDNKLAVVGAEYSLDTGIIEFFDGDTDDGTG